MYSTKFEKTHLQVKDKLPGQVLLKFEISIKVRREWKGQEGQEGQKCKKCNFLGELVFIISLAFFAILRIIWWLNLGFLELFSKAPKFMKIGLIDLNSIKDRLLNYSMEISFQISFWILSLDFHKKFQVNIFKTDWENWVWMKLGKIANLRSSIFKCDFGAFHFRWPRGR